MSPCGGVGVWGGSGPSRLDASWVWAVVTGCLTKQSLALMCVMYSSLRENRFLSRAVTGQDGLTGETQRPRPAPVLHEMPPNARVHRRLCRCPVSLWALPTAQLTP